jgi:two-component system phosphate regulon sensor histidine kinase PhoR
LGIKGRTIGSYILLLLTFTLLTLLHAKGLIATWIAIFLAIVGTGIILYFTIVRLLRPLEELISTTYDLAGGILDKEIMINANNEIDELASSINVIAQQLRQYINRMYDEQSRAKAILNSMGEGVIALDAEGRVLMVNPMLIKHFKINKDNSVGKELIEVIRSYELDQLLRQVLKTKESSSNEIKIFITSPRIYLVYATPLKSAAGKQLGVVALITDVTERRQLEKMRTDFVANVSHELKTPLTSIKGFLETLLDGALEDQKTAEHFLNIMKTETDRLTRLIDDLLKLSKLEDKRTTLNKQQLDLADVVSQVMQIFIGRADDKNIELTAKIQRNLPLILGEKDLLVQVLVNLVDNAIKHIPEGETVNITVELDKDNPKVLIAVADTGSGIPTENLPRLFERFYRVDKARSRDAGGTGLGLSIVKHVVEQHGGEIWVDSSPQGTIFTFSLPL